MLMKDRFYNWLIDKGYAENTAYSYTNLIDKISNHYSDNLGENINIYALKNLDKVEKIKNAYSLNGEFSDYGNNGNGTIRNAIARYLEFATGLSDKDDISITTVPPVEVSDGFSYEKDLQKSLCSQIKELFPDYQVFKSINIGKEFSVAGKRIDCLLEHKINKDLLVLELKAGKADYKVFGQISMYIGLLQKKFPNIDITGAIIAQNIDKTLKEAVAITDKVSLYEYEVKLNLKKSKV